MKIFISVFMLKLWFPVCRRSSNKSNKGMRSPPSHRAKKMYRSRGDPGTGSSSDADGRNVSKKTKDLEIGNSGKGPVDEYGNLGRIERHASIGQL